MGKIRMINCYSAFNGRNGISIDENTELELINVKLEHNKKDGLKVYGKEEILKDLGFAGKYDPVDLAAYLKIFGELNIETQLKEIQSPSFVTKFKNFVLDISTFGANLITIVTNNQLAHLIQLLLR